VSSKNKTQLKDLAYALNVAMEGTSKELIARINDHFDQNEALRDHPRYAGIFNRARAPISVDLPTVTPLADVVNIDSNAVAGPSHLLNFYANFNGNVPDQSLTYSPHSVPYPALNNPAIFDAPGSFTDLGGEFYDTHNSYMYRMPDCHGPILTTM
jgi:hypothetical protein